MKTSLYLIASTLLLSTYCPAQKKAISEELLGIFFEDINFGADGGLNAELLQNGAFEYSASDRGWGQETWQPMTAWRLERWGTQGYASVETAQPLNHNNRHYVDLTIEAPVHNAVGLRNLGWDGIPIKAGAKYEFSAWLRVNEGGTLPATVTLQAGDKAHTVVAESTLDVSGDKWQKYNLELTATAAADSASMLLMFKAPGHVSVDQVSLLPADTYKGHGLRRDLCEALEALHPRFMRFPGGCVAHGHGIGNIYQWKRTIGPVEQRAGQRNLWGYRQSYQMGYHELLQLCEDIGATPLPVVAAGVTCQYARQKASGQEAIPMADMPAYVQDVLDLIEYCNGDASTTWGKQRAANGHPKPFNLKYLGLGNEDKITPAFEERMTMLCQAVKSKYPDIQIIGTAGAMPEGENFEKGWALSRRLGNDLIDEHYYAAPEWLMSRLHRYDGYERKGPKVYLGEWASKGSKWHNALAEAAYLTSLERNADIVRLASYAPLFGRLTHTQWNPDLIYFDNHGVYPSVNYLIQQLFGCNGGAYYIDGVCKTDTTLQTSCVQTKTGNVIIKIVNTGAEAQPCHIDLAPVGKHGKQGALTLLQGKPDDINDKQHPNTVQPVVKPYKVAGKMDYQAPPYSVSMIRF